MVSTACDKRQYRETYERVNDDFFPKLHVWYHLDPETNDLLAITYNWDFYNPRFNPDKNKELLLLCLTNAPLF